ncbi:cell division protein ZipA [Bathymodiolus platifrons methanotrophic gill symbiont]|uniref:cell division protein ZipA C-terminal FtsZ-binding domain-containing protein n=1 Tax=Bathymodiolus platifrons methanotrophic gill symbiont TaxID=113268 RepID=UPI000B41D3B7|nr:cell division protein ZipA C-terminal FtsZ-binding domain-containing protein [Bathymodiolus platifrons methanotrophic gill symbiont]MCK5869447.1 cell division protein ZipA C-terminal FtsZ-binding domain-containing protein [Methyloprofundus sp.]TXK94891.1 cell division protein [Methylococcaceae bacterium CS5]TXK95952.1 cell division protein [Methylococcaceae bacterium CS4]TXL03486.1 cell division protein [Methylococcaceae bacterium CS1]TXL06394.1 cell division protein [Methylococcaceae bacte
MDKDLLRLVIIAVGAVVILAMILWAMFSGGSKRKKINFYDNHDPLENIDPSLVVSTEEDDFDIVPINTGENNDSQVKTRLNTKYMQEAQQSGVDANELAPVDEVEQESQQSLSEDNSLPALIQLSLVPKTDDGFSGIQLLEAFENTGLIYGSVKVFEKLDDLNQVDYAVASMEEPGIFPGDDWETHLCPGLNFFMQPRELENAAQVFDEMIETIGQLSLALKGDVLDQNNQRLTEESLQQIKASLV